MKSLPAEISGFSPEANLLLSCAVSSNSTNPSRNEISKEVDWSKLLDLGIRNRMIPQLYSRLKENCNEFLPAEILSNLHTTYEAISVRNLFLTRELLRILSLLERNNIEAIPYKGPALAQTLYGNVVGRHFWDLDILLRKEDILPAHEILVQEGYVSEYTFDFNDEKNHLENDCEWSFDKSQGQIHLELHWGILPKYFGLGGDWRDRLWESRASIVIAGQKIRSIPPEYLLLILCVHGGDKHRWNCLRWISDVAGLIEVSNEMDWDKVLDQAEAYKKQETLFLGLYLVNRLLEVQIPSEIQKKFEQYPRIKAAAVLYIGRLFREDGGLPGFSEWRAYLADLEPSRSRKNSRWPRISDLYRYLRALSAPHNTDRHVSKFPHQLAFLYSVYRPFRLLQKHRTKVFSRLR